jgi:hypothetical protein
MTLVYKKIIRALIGIVLFAVVVFPTAGEPVLAQEATCSGQFIPVSLPLNDLGPNEYIRMDGTQTGFSGGLYSNGSNNRPANHESAGVQISNDIVPLNTAGYPDPMSGKVVFISVGMSNTSQEFEKFIDQISTDYYVNPFLEVVDGAVPGAPANLWVDPSSETWDRLESAVADSGSTAAQVQVAWLKLAQVGSGTFPQKAQSLQGDLETVVRTLKSKYPNLKLTYVSSRTRSYLYTTGLSPEPDAFETGFSVKWMIEKQINGDLSLNFDPAKGPVVAPYLSWGPYLWIDGHNPRSDGLTWLQSDLTWDCVHPSEAGMDKVATQLHNFFNTDATSAAWFLGGDGNPPLPTTPPPNLGFNIYLPVTISSSTRN